MPQLSWDGAMKRITFRPLNATGCVLLMGFNAMVYLNPNLYRPRLFEIFDLEEIDVLFGGTNFASHVLTLNGPGGMVMAFEGTRNSDQWFGFVANAGVVDLGNKNGTVFAPFWTSARPLVSLVQAKAQGKEYVYLTGHSLGAAVAPICAQLLRHQELPIRAGTMFAQPRFCDSVFRRTFPLDTVYANHPFDPIPLAPPDVVSALARYPIGPAWAEPLAQCGQPFWLPRWISAFPQGSTQDWITAVATSNLSPRWSVHQTFRYLKDLVGCMDGGDLVQYRPFLDLLTDLRLFEPWD